MSYLWTIMMQKRVPVGDPPPVNPYLSVDLTLGVVATTVREAMDKAEVEQPDYICIGAQPGTRVDIP